LSDAEFKYGGGLGGNSKFKIENSKLGNVQTATQQSEPQISDNGKPLPEKR
jgi:hypothetical protein